MEAFVVGKCAFFTIKNASQFRTVFHSDPCNSHVWPEIYCSSRAEMGRSIVNHKLDNDSYYIADIQFQLHSWWRQRCRCKLAECGFEIVFFLSVIHWIHWMEADLAFLFVWSICFLTSASIPFDRSTLSDWKYANCHMKRQLFTFAGGEFEMKESRESTGTSYSIFDEIFLFHQSLGGKNQRNAVINV